jgi:hypothetical protein
MDRFLDQTGLAQRLALSERQIRNLETDGVILRRPDNLYDVRACQRRYHIFRAGDIDAVAGEIERSSGALTGAMNVLLSIENIEQRRQMMKTTVGPLVGVLDGWLRLACALSPAGPRREFEKRFVAMTIGFAVSDLLAACQIRVADDDDSRTATADADRD